MLIDEALAGVDVLERGSGSADVTGVQYDSRRVMAGDVFVAMKGESSDGNRFIETAIALGARAIVTDSREAWATGGAVPFYLVGNGRRALAGVAANVFGHPEQTLKVSAVTGTNGKTTTAFLLEQMLKSINRKCLLIGTIETHVGDEIRVSEHTTPESRDLLALFADGVKAGCTEAVMEMSSHALAQERVWGVPVDVAMFTNLTQDHLDYHGTMERYFQAKARLFEGVGADAPRVAVVNEDSPAGVWLLIKDLGPEVMSYGIKAGEFRAADVALSAGRTQFLWETPYGAVQIDSPLTGKVNVYNLLAASCAAMARGLALEEIAVAARDCGRCRAASRLCRMSLGLRWSSTTPTRMMRCETSSDWRVSWWVKAASLPFSVVAEIVTRPSARRWGALPGREATWSC